MQYVHEFDDNANHRLVYYKYKWGPGQEPPKPTKVGEWAPYVDPAYLQFTKYKTFIYTDYWEGTHIKPNQLYRTVEVNWPVFTRTGVLRT